VRFIFSGRSAKPRPMEAEAIPKVGMVTETLPVLRPILLRRVMTGGG